jgi:hypothetical protein
MHKDTISKKRNRQKQLGKIIVLNLKRVFHEYS